MPVSVFGGEGMSNVKIENFSGDTVNVIFNGETYTLRDEERVSVEALEKGVYDVRVHRARIPMETEDFHEAQNAKFSERMEKSDKSQHVQLDGLFSVDINSTKAVLTVKTKVQAKEKFGIDAFFSGYTLEAAGSKVENARQVFSSEGIKKGFIRHQIKEAFLPVGAGGIFLLILGFIALGANIAGKTVNIGGQDFTYPWSVGLVAVGLGFVGYTVFVIVSIFKNANKFKK